MGVCVGFFSTETHRVIYSCMQYQSVRLSRKMTGISNFIDTGGSIGSRYRYAGIFRCRLFSCSECNIRQPGFRFRDGGGDLKPANYTVDLIAGRALYRNSKLD